MAERKPFELREGQGFLFTNSRKRAENHPDFEGTVNIAGQVWRIAGWEKTAKNGKLYFSLRVSELRQSEDDDAPF